MVSALRLINQTKENEPDLSLDMSELLSLCIKEGASDLHLTENEPPLLRIHGALERTKMPAFNRHQLQTLIYQLLTDQQQVKFERELELDFALSLPQLDRFRANIHRQRGAIEAAFRHVPTIIPTMQALGLPPIVADLIRAPNGLVLVTGPTGMGKTTSLAAMIEQIISERQCLVVAIEDPIEFVHVNNRGVVKQREVHADTHSFANALRHALRQDPDVIVIGEMRDLETISIALTAAETGHLVLATMHTPDASQSIERIIDVYPPFQQRQVQLQLASSLQGIIAQQLLPKFDNSGMVLATEILVATPGVRNLIREHAIEQITTMIQTGGKQGMATMDKSIVKLYQERKITREAALAKMSSPDDIDKL